MSRDLNRKWMHAVIVASLACAPRAALAEDGEKGAGKPKAEGGKEGHDHHGDAKGPGHGMMGRGEGKGLGGPDTKDAKPAAVVVQGPQAAQAVDATTTTCAKALELRQNIETVAAKRTAALAAIATAQRESRKQLLGVAAAQRKLQHAAGKAGTDSAALLETGRVAYEAAVAQAYTVETETRTLQTTEDELGKLVTAAEEAATACAAAETTLRTAADAAKRAAAAARKEAAKARLLARLLPAKALEAMRAKQTRELEALKANNDKAKATLEAMKSGPPPAKKPEKAATPTAKAPKTP